MAINSREPFDLQPPPDFRNGPIFTGAGEDEGPLEKRRW
jgi:hypothetical protein